MVQPCKLCGFTSRLVSDYAKKPAHKQRNQKTEEGNHCGDG